MAAPQRRDTVQEKTQAHVLIVEARFYDALADELLKGAVERLSAEINFQLFGLGASRAAAERMPYFVHLLAHMPASGETIVLAAIQGQLNPGQMDYSGEVDCAPPAVGRYQLLATVVLSDYNAVGAMVGPPLTVIPFDS